MSVPVEIRLRCSIQNLIDFDFEDYPEIYNFLG